MYTFEGADGTVIFMGRDKYENEKLIAYGFDEDVWFHVDNMSSAHVYVRLAKGRTIEDISPELLEECLQLTKANSISGCKLGAVDVVYTPWSNLKKTDMMDVGQVSFFDDKKVKKVRVEKKNAVVNRLEKTKKECDPNFQAEREKYDNEKRREAQREKKERQQKEKEEKEERERIARNKQITFDESEMVTNADLAKRNISAQEFEDGFM